MISLYLKWGNENMKEKQFLLAIYYFNLALDLKLDNPDNQDLYWHGKLYYLRGLAMTSIEEFKLAVNDFSKAMEYSNSWKYNANLLQRRAEIYFKMGGISDIEHSISDYKTCLKKEFIRVQLSNKEKSSIKKRIEEIKKVLEVEKEEKPKDMQEIQKDCCSKLQITFTSRKDDFMKAYRSQALKCHLDKQALSLNESEKNKMTRKFLKITEAKDRFIESLS